jgi:hypothetical protein
MSLKPILEVSWSDLEAVIAGGTPCVNNALAIFKHQKYAILAPQGVSPCNLEDMVVRAVMQWAHPQVVVWNSMPVKP